MFKIVSNVVNKSIKIVDKVYSDLMSAAFVLYLYCKCYHHWLLAVPRFAQFSASYCYFLKILFVTLDYFFFLVSERSREVHLVDYIVQWIFNFLSSEGSIAGMNNKLKLQQIFYALEKISNHEIYKNKCYELYK